MSSDLAVDDAVTYGTVVDLINRGCVKARVLNEGPAIGQGEWEYIIPANVSPGNADDVRICARVFLKVLVPKEERKFIGRDLTGPEVQGLIFLGAKMDQFFVTPKELAL